MGVNSQHEEDLPSVPVPYLWILSTKDKVHIACEKVMLVQRDNGNRKPTARMLV